jgi:hypothetical protein
MLSSWCSSENIKVCYIGWHYGNEGSMNFDEHQNLLDKSMILPILKVLSKGCALGWMQDVVGHFWNHNCNLCMVFYV